jgi:mono/diheme cytochrome c family protein
MRQNRVALVVVVALMVALGLVAADWIGSGISTRDQPSRLETFVARRVRAFAIPASARSAANPVTLTPDVLVAARAHFADHCASCHANDGSGQTEIGQNLYPKAPDMRLPATQNLTDGELFYIIHNGIRLTGMPAWGGADEHADEDSWKLVYFVRRLPALTPAEIAEMESLNPKSPSELEEEREDQRFLNESEAEPPRTGHEGMKMPAAERPKHDEEHR